MTYDMSKCPFFEDEDDDPGCCTVCQDNVARCKGARLARLRTEVRELEAEIQQKYPIPVVDDYDEKIEKLLEIAKQQVKDEHKHNRLTFTSTPPSTSNRYTINAATYVDNKTHHSASAEDVEQINSRYQSMIFDQWKRETLAIHANRTAPFNIKSGGD